MTNDKSAEAIVQGRIDAIKARCEAATPGPWYATANGYISNGHQTNYIAFVGGSGDPAVKDAEFIAHSRADIPYLLERIAALEGQLARYREAIDIAAKKVIDLDLETCEIGHEGSCCPVGHMGLPGVTGSGQWDEHCAKLEMIQAVAESVRGKTTILQTRISASQQRERAAVEDLKVMALAMRESEELPEGCCFACLYDGQNLPENVILAYGECPGYDTDKCFEWRGSREESFISRTIDGVETAVILRRGPQGAGEGEP